MLDLEVRPERSLGCDQWEFILGMHFSQAVAIIQSQVGVIKGVQVLYSDTDPLGVDIVINLPQDGIRLIFDPVVQRMKGVEVFNMKLVKLKYCGLPFSSPEVAPSLEQIEHSFGATHPGVYDAAKQLFALHFRGLSFYFPVDSKLQPGYAHGLGSLHFPNGSSPVVSKMSMYCGGSAAETRVTPPLPLSCYNQQLYVDSVQVLRNSCGTKGIRLQLYTEGSVRVLEPRKQTMTREVMFGDTCQDVASSLGCPNRVFFKSEDKMKIHSPNAHRGSQHRRSDYFFNYFTLGLDILFDARTQRCKKIILHTNYPGHYNYNMYHRCEFQLQLPADKASDEDTTGSPVTVTAYAKWDTISSRLAPSERPVVLHRASSTNTANPFGSTFCYGYQDIIFEVMSNNYIASVTLYSTTPYPGLWSGKATAAAANMSSSMTASKLQALNHNSNSSNHLNSSNSCSANGNKNEMSNSSNGIHST